MENFNAAYLRVKLLYNISMDPIEFEEIGLIAWNKIGTKETYLYTLRTTIDPVTLSVELPCNLLEIESVTCKNEDWKRVSNKHYLGDLSSHYSEHYSELRIYDKDPLYVSGAFAKYRREGNTLIFDKNYGTITILYKGIILDDEGLPFLSERQIEAIACYCAYTIKQRDAWATNNQNTMQFAQALEQKWMNLCSLARLPNNINQNDMDKILNAKTSWNRKMYNKSYKPVK